MDKESGDIIAAAISEHLHYARVYFNNGGLGGNILVVDPKNHRLTTMCIGIEDGCLLRYPLKISLADPECIPRIVQIIDEFYWWIQKKITASQRCENRTDN